MDWKESILYPLEVDNVYTRCIIKRLTILVNRFL